MLPSIECRQRFRPLLPPSMRGPLLLIITLSAAPASLVAGVLPALLFRQPSKFLSERYVGHEERKGGNNGAEGRPVSGTGFDLSLGTLIYLPWPFVNAAAHWLLLPWLGLPAVNAPEVVGMLVLACAVGLEQEIIHRQVHTIDSVRCCTA